MRRGPDGLTPRERLALDAAKLYHVRGLSQQEVADILHLSRPHVSKLLASAREHRFVRTVVEDPRETDESLIEGLRSRFELVDLRLVVPVGRGPMDRRRALGAAAADMLDSHTLSDRDVVGFWWQGAGQEVLEAMARLRLRVQSLVQLDGPGPDGRVDPALAAFADRSTTAVHLCPEQIVHESIEARIEAEGAPETRRVLTLQAACDLAVFGTGPPDVTALRAADLVSDQEHQLLQEHAVGRLCGRFIDAQGRVVGPSLNQRVLGPTLSDLRRVKSSVLVAGGTEQLPAIRAALANRYANHLVTDVETATLLASSP